MVSHFHSLQRQCGIWSMWALEQDLGSNSSSVTLKGEVSKSLWYTISIQEVLILFPLSIFVESMPNWIFYVFWMFWLLSI